MLPLKSSCNKERGENNTQIDCILWTDDVTIMTSSSKKFLCMFKITNPYKTYISDFSYFKN